MNTAPRVSVIITSYNHERFVAEAIESVLRQDMQDWELIIRDDGSTDGTASVITSFSDPRIRFLGSGPRLGASRSFNECLAVARAPYIAILNSDDAFEPNKLSTQLRFLDNREDIAAVFCRVSLVKENGEAWEQPHPYCQLFEQANRSRHEWLKHFFAEGNCLCDPTAIVRKRIFDEIGAYDPRLASLPDMDFWIRLCLAHEIWILPEKLLRFRLRSNEANESGRRPAMLVRLHAEIACCLEHYRKLSYDDFRLIFTEIVEVYGPDVRDVDFLLAQHCLNQTSPIVRQFGLRTLYQLAEKPERMENIAGVAKYGYIDLYQQAAAIDVWGAGGAAYLAKTSLRLLDGDNRHLEIDAQIELGAANSFFVCFDLSTASLQSAPREFHWVPLRGSPCSVRVCRALLNDVELNVEPLNAIERHQDHDVFFKSLPCYLLTLPENTTLATDNGGLDTPRQILIEGFISVLTSSEIAKKHISYVKRVKKEQQKEAKRARRQRELLEKCGRSPMQALKLWWNRNAILREFDRLSS